MRFLAILLSIFLATSAWSETLYEHELAALSSPVTTAEASSRLSEQAKSDPTLRGMLSSKLPGMLLLAKDWEVVQSEARLAGALKMESAIPSLVYRLGHDDDDEIDHMHASTRASDLSEHSCAYALYEIGEPALPALTEALKSNSMMFRFRVVQILEEADTPETRAILKRHLVVEPDASLRDYIGAHGISGGILYDLSHQQ